MLNPRHFFMFLVLLAAIILYHPNEAHGDEAVESQSALLGRWTGIAHDTDEWNAAYHAETPIDFEFKLDKGSLVLIDRGRMSTRQLSVPVRLCGRQFFARYQRLFTNIADIEGVLAEDGRSLTVTISGDGMTGLDSHTARLQRDGIDARRFDAPRIDARGQVMDYHYRSPQDEHDGLSVSTASAVGMDVKLLTQMVVRILSEGKALDAPQIDSVLIQRDGKLIFEEYFWGQTADNPHIISSAQKSVTSMIAGLAWDQHLFQLDDLILLHFPERQSTWWGREKYPITIRNVLSMSSGTYWDDGQPPPQNPSVLLLQTGDVTRYVLDRPLVRPPGLTFEYNNGLPVLTGELIETLTKQRLDELADEKLFAPLGIRNYRWTRNRQGDPMAAGGSYFRSRDMLKLGQLMLNNGQWAGKRILSEAWIRESTSRQTAPDQYNYGFYVRRETKLTILFLSST
jgi:CubicO group peptidase (beta-lactamase class C family)